MPSLDRRTFGALTLAGAAAAVLGAVPSASAAPAVPVPAGAVDPLELVSNDALVRAWYRDFLGRTPAQALSDTSRRYWVAALDAGAAPSDVLWAITHGREHVEQQVTSSYLDLLGRAPDAGAGAWVDGVLAGRFPLEWVEQNVLASDELARLRAGGAGGTEFLVDAWYARVLGRVRVSGAEEAYWGARIAAVGRLGALRELYYAPEAVAHRVRGHHSALLRRAASAAEVAYWSPKEVESDVNVAVLLASSPEYRGDRAVT